jgi:hypothetical protein
MVVRRKNRGEKMTMWEKIVEAQARKQDKLTFNEDGQEVQIKVIQNGWYEGFVSMS